MRSEAEIKKQIEEIKEKEKYARNEANMRLKLGNDWYLKTYGKEFRGNHEKIN